MCNQSSRYEKYGKFSVMKRKPSQATTKSTLFTVSKDKWNSKEGTGKSIIVCTVVCQKVPLRPKQCQTVKKSSM